MPTCSRISHIVLAAAILAGSLLVLNAAQPPGSFACSCALQPTPAGGWTRETLLQQGDVVFRGNVVETSRETGEDGRVYVSVTFAVHEFWKGPVTDTFPVRTSSDGASCGLAIGEGQDWLIYGYTDPSGSVDASLCSRSAPARLATSISDLTALGQGITVPSTTPDRDQPTPGTASDEDSSWLMPGALAFGCVLAAGAAAIVLRRRASQPR